MSRENRKTLKAYFKAGSLPSQNQFEDLIDSMLNIIDEGFDKSPKEGFKIAQLSDTGKLLSFFENTDMKSPLWSIRIDPAADPAGSSNHLVIEGRFRDDVKRSRDDVKRVLSLSAEGRVGINKKAPVHALDIEGFVASTGRIGGKSGSIAANGEWQPITEELTGCHAFEIMAGVGGRERAGKYALLHAFALNTFAAKGPFHRRHKIKRHQAYYGSRCNRLRLRWKRCNKHAHTYQLELRTACSYGDNIVVKYYLTDLWPNSNMGDSRTEAKGH